MIEPVAEKHGIPMLEIALRWVRHHSTLKFGDQGGNDGIVMGISSYEQLVQNVGFVKKGPLPEEVVEALDKAWGVAMRTQPK
jgi:aflatoxin B1 aldehyde reductase